MPKFLGHAYALVILSGFVEFVLAALLLFSPTREIGGLLAIAFLIAVFPANINMAFEGGLAGVNWPLNSVLLAWLRLPLQPLLIWMTWLATRPI